MVECEPSRYRDDEGEPVGTIPELREKDTGGHGRMQEGTPAFTSPPRYSWTLDPKGKNLLGLLNQENISFSFLGASVKIKYNK